MGTVLVVPCGVARDTRMIGSEKTGERCSPEGEMRRKRRQQAAALHGAVEVLSLVRWGGIYV